MKAGAISALAVITAFAAATSLAVCNRHSPGSASNTSSTDAYSRSSDSMARSPPSANAAAPSGTSPSSAPSRPTATNGTTSPASGGMASNGATPVPGRPMPASTSLTGGAADDAALTRQVRSALASEPALRSLAINVDTRHATVTLTGAVDSAASKARANEVAAGVNGVVAVVDHLTVRAS
jgi:hyperosmotically inducible protein